MLSAGEAVEAVAAVRWQQDTAYATPRYNEREGAAPLGGWGTSWSGVLAVSPALTSVNRGVLNLSKCFLNLSKLRGVLNLSTFCLKFF